MKKSEGRRRAKVAGTAKVRDARTGRYAPRESARTRPATTVVERDRRRGSP